jgi:putative ABC transport system substrate-binding protein
MNKNLRKWMALGAAACLTASCLMGCGSTTESNTTTTEAATEAGDTTEAAVGDDTVYTIGICQLVQHDALDRATQGFEDALVALLGEDHVVFDYQNAQGDSQTCATIANQFVASDVDLIMANATAALQACANATNTIPVVGTSVTSFASALDIELDENAATGINVTGTNDLAPLDEQAQMIADLFPDVQQVGILYCSAEVNSVYQAEHIAEYLDELNIAHANYSFADSNDLQSVVINAVADCDVLYIPTDNTAASNTNLIDAIARPAGVPIIAGEEGICEGCGLASLSIDFYDIGYRAGEQAYDILVNGADPATMTVEDPQTLSRVYNAEIAEALGITLGDDYTALDTE